MERVSFLAMARFFLFLIVICAVNIQPLATADSRKPAVFCYYNSESFYRSYQAKMMPSDLELALPLCTHLVYGYAGLNATTNKMVSLSPNRDLDQGHANFRVVTQLKRKFPDIKILLSVGGGVDTELKDSYKYNTVLETPESRDVFIKSASVLLKNYAFDGIDLAWQFRTIKPHNNLGNASPLWYGFKKLFKSNSDELFEEHKERFSKFVQEMKNALYHDKMLLTVSVLPNINSSLCFDTQAIMNHIDYAILHGYDYMTPKRNPKEADYTSPLYQPLKRNKELNINFLTSHWVNNGFPIQKLILAIPTFGRAWKWDSNSAISGVPPLYTDGPAHEGPYTEQKGLLSYPEICQLLHNEQREMSMIFKKVTDPSKRYGTYAFRVPDDKDAGGMWVSYEDPQTSGNKGSFIRAKGLAGVAIVDLSMDDFRGLCSGDKLPILRAVIYRL